MDAEIGFIYSTVFKNPDNPTFWNFGSSVSSVNINRTTDNNYIIGWSQVNGSTYSNHYVRNTTLSTIKNFGTTGKDIQINNGANFNSLYANSLTVTTTPYSFFTSNSVGLIGKENVHNNISSGREIVLYNDNGQVFYGVGDIFVNGNEIRFADLNDSTDLKSLAGINDIMQTEPFEIGNDFTFNVQYGISDSSDVRKIIKGNNEIIFKIELIEDGTDAVLGEYGILTLNSENITQLKNITYEVKVTDVISKIAKLRVRASANFEIYGALSQKYAEEYVIKKSSSSKKAESVPLVYEMSQNYPNPFNPVTIINYQLPKAGNTTLKIYDLLGKVVATLVDEYKTEGRFSVEFNGSNLSSGMYLYELRANDFSSAKKMILMK